MNTKLKWETAGRLRRAAVVLGVVGLAAGAGLASAGSALAGVGSQPGNLEVLIGGSVVTSGALSATATWATTTACPSGDQTSAQLQEWTVPPGTAGTSIAPAINSSSEALNVPFSGALDTGATVGALLNFAGVSATSPGTVEWVVGCDSAAGGTGTLVATQSLFVSVAAGATTFTTSATGPVIISTTTTLTATPNPAPTSSTPNVNLSATVEAANSTFPVGTVQFQFGCPATCTNIGTPVAVNTGSVNVPATSSVGFAAAGNEALSAVFTPSSTTTYSGSTGTFQLSVGSSLAGGTNPEVISVQVPSTGSLSVTVGSGAVTLTPASPQTTPDETATGQLSPVTVTDSRNTLPGWSVAGQESVFTESPGTGTIPANSLGWTPAFGGTGAVGGAVIGAAVAPVGADTGSSGPGLGAAATLASATPGNGIGTNILNAALLLDIPASTPPGAYAGSLTITYVTAGP